MDTKEIRKELDFIDSELKDLGFLEKLLSETVNALFIESARYGEDKYGAPQELGLLWIDRYNCKKGNIKLEFTPSEQTREREKEKCNYVQTTVLSINLEKNTYKPNWEDGWYPLDIIKDTKKVMELLGIKEE